MRCNAIIVTRTNPKTGKKSKFISFERGYGFVKALQYIRDHTKPSIQPELDLAKNTCDGKIEANIVAKETPTWGGTAPELDVEFQCNKCGHNYYPGLPNDEDSLNIWLNKLLEKME